MEIEKQSINILKHNRLLDKLITHTDRRVRVAAAEFVEAFQPPADAPYLKRNLNRLLNGLQTFQSDSHLEKETEYAISSIMLLIEVSSPLEEDEERADEMPTSNWLKKFAAYGALNEIVDDDTASLKALAAAFVLSQLTSKSIDKKFADQVRRESVSVVQLPGVVFKGKEKSWESTHQRHIKHILALNGTRPLYACEEFQDSAIRHYLADTKFASRNLRRGQVDDRSLTKHAFTDTVIDLRRALIEFDAVPTAICTGFFSGLTWPLAQRIPLVKPKDANWVIWLDISQGCLHINLNPVVRGAAAARGEEKYVPATREFKRFLPQLVSKSLQFLSIKQPNAPTLGGLCKSTDVPSEMEIYGGDDRRVKNSIARFYNSRSSISNMLEISGIAAALTLSCFERIPHSRLFYNTTSQEQIRAALIKLEGLLGWGDIPDNNENQLPDIGSSVVPELVALANIGRQLASAVRDAQPPKNYRWKHIKKFHNAICDYTLYVASLCGLGRDSEELLLQGVIAISQTGLSGLHDKVTYNSFGASPICISAVARAQINAYLNHLKFLLKRMEKLQIENAECTQLVQTILDGEECSNTFFHFDEEDKIAPRGTATLYRDLSGWLEIKPDAGRHFWEAIFTKADTPEHYSDAQARHTVKNASYWSSSSTMSLHQMQDALTPIQDRIFKQLEIVTVQGLVK